METRGSIVQLERLKAEPEQDGSDRTGEKGSAMERTEKRASVKNQDTFFVCFFFPDEGI